MFTLKMHISGRLTSNQPIMPHSFVFGHLLVLKKLLSRAPGDVHINYISQRIMEEWRTLFPDQHECPPVFYMDMWPMGPAIAFVLDPKLGQQFMQEGLSKDQAVLSWLKPLTNNLDIGSAEGPAWKTWRARFNPGFSAKNVTTLVPQILEEIETFVDRMKGHCGPSGKWGSVFALEPPGTDLTFDVIGRVVL
jgi:cytochrome P450